MDKRTGFCECGCGDRTPISTYTNRGAGIFEGVPQRFIRNHHLRLRRRDPEERFWEKVERGGRRDCWPWRGNMHRTGYGNFWVGEDRGMVSAHRLAWEFVNGDIPDDLHVLHTCDNRACVNPAHLWLGTNADNMADMVAKGRTGAPKGERCARSRFTAKQVRELRRRRAGGESTRALARAFGMSYTNAKDIVNRKTWKHL